MDLWHHTWTEWDEISSCFSLMKQWYSKRGSKKCFNTIATYSTNSFDGSKCMNMGLKPRKDEKNQEKEREANIMKESNENDDK